MIGVGLYIQLLGSFSGGFTSILFEFDRSFVSENLQLEIEIVMVKEFFVEAKNKYI